MDNEKVFAMSTKKVFECLVAKAVRKGRTRDEAVQVTCWLTGYTEADIDRILTDDMPYGSFFENAPRYNENSCLITGSVCGVKLSEIEHPTMLKIRQLDKLIDELAKGKPIEKILRH